MALTQVPIELSSTPGIVDNSNATAITIDSSENVTFSGTVTADGLTVEGTSDLRLDSTEVYSSTAQNTSQLTIKNWDSTTAYTPSVVSLQARGSTTTTSNWQLGNAGLNTAYSESDFFIKNRIGSSGFRQRLLIEGNGNLSLYEDTGTTPKFFWDSSAETLTVGGNDSTTSSGLKSLILGEYTDSGSGVVFRASSASAINFEDSNASTAGRLYYNHTSDYMAFNTAASERMRIDSSGNVGIGTSSPASYYADKLVVSAGYADGITIAASATTDINYLMFADTTTSIGQGWIGYYHNGDALTFASNNAERMRIDSSGAISMPDVYNDTTAAAANMHISSAGGLLFRSTSSARYKNTIIDATHGLTELLTLRPVTYKGNNDGDTVFGGLIAEEVHDAGLTEFVQYNDEDEPDALAYGNMVSLCIKAIQEQQTLIESQAAAITDLTTRLTALENN